MSEYSGSVDPSSHEQALSGWGGRPDPAPRSPEQAARLQEHDEPVAAAHFGAALPGDLGSAPIADEILDEPDAREPDTSLGHEGSRRYETPRAADVPAEG